MARPRTPLAKAEATGRTIHDPQRYRDRKEQASEPLGEPSRHLKMLELEAWEQLKREASWLMESHRGVVEATAKLRVRVWLGGDLKVMALHLAHCRELGLTPTSASKVHVPQGEEADPAAEFLQ
jgi:hypothetical protein